MEQLVLMKQLQDTNYYVNVLLLSSATANSLLHLEVQSLPCVCVFFFSARWEDFSIGSCVYGRSVLKCKKGHKAPAVVIECQVH